MFASIASAQVPDLLTALDSGGRAMGMGGATRVTDGSTLSALDNPAGLAYITSPVASASVRNLPKSSTTVSGNFNDPASDFDERSGRTAVSHVGYAFPYQGGTIGISYTVGGHIDNTTTGNGLANGALTVVGLQQTSRAQTDFFTVGYGKTIGGNMNFGASLVIANQYVKFAQSYALFNGNTQVGTVNSDVSSNGMGIGLVAGVQGVLDEMGTMQYGLSVRTPINLTNNSDTESIYDVIPGKASLGVAGQVKGVGQGNEYMIWAAQMDYFFGGKGGALFQRRNTLNYSLGFEYNFNRFDARIPFRIGFQGVPSGGNGFDRRDALTFGLGYYPNGKPYSLDLSFARSIETGKFDIGLGFIYRPAP